MYSGYSVAFEEVFIDYMDTSYKCTNVVYVYVIVLYLGKC